MLRGVFVCLFTVVVFGYSPVCVAWQMEVVYDRQDMVKPWRVSGGLPLAVRLTEHHKLKGYLEHSSDGADAAVELHWQYDSPDTSLQLFYGTSEVTSSDPLRVLHRRRHGQDTLLGLREGSRRRVAMGRHLLGSDSSHYNVVWLETAGTGLSSSMLAYAMPWQWRNDAYSSAVGIRSQLFGEYADEISQRSWGLVHTLHRADSKGRLDLQQDFGGFMDLQWQQGSFSSELEFIYMPPGASSPVGAYSSIPTDRVGWRGTFQQEYDRWSLQLDVQDLLRFDGQREYLRRWWKVAWGRDVQIQMVVRRLPQPNLVVSLVDGPSSWLWNHKDGRFSWTRQWPPGRIRVDATVDGRLRLELRWGQQGSRWHTVVKRHLLTGAWHCYAAWNKDFGLWSLGAAYGQYDRGHLGTQWNANSRLRFQISRAL